MTDAFMTACVVAVAAAGRTNITGIANQRVKECNRIAAMVTELSKLGVECGELEDGIWVQGVGGPSGKGRGSLRGGAVHCYDDHRIAMAFAVLGCWLPGVVVTDKECTEKTWPEFWDSCLPTLGIQTTASNASKEQEDAEEEEEEEVEGGGGGGAAAAAAAADAAQDAGTTTNDPSVVVVGMRGAGKSTLGKSAAEALGLGE